MSQFLTIREMFERFDAEWVLIENPQLSETLEVQGGEVHCHSTDRDEVYRHARQAAPKNSAIVYTGKRPDDAAIVV